VLSTRGLSRSYPTPTGTVDAVHDLTIDVATGAAVALLGPNGAGKSTTLRMLATLLRPTAGTATVAGHDLVGDPNAVRSRIGYLPQGGGSGAEQRVRDELVIQGRLHRLTAAAAIRRADELLATFGLTDLATRTAGTLSGGQRRRLDLALALTHTPGLLLLDEPSTGLDPAARAALWEQLRTLRTEHGSTVLLCTHYLDEADALCDRILIIDNGRVIADGSPDELRDRVPDPSHRPTLQETYLALVGTADTTAHSPGGTHGRG
jgi:ABC-2 type transport system ATP-binding protein